MLFVLKRFLSLLKVDLLLVKSFGKLKITFFIIINIIHWLCLFYISSKGNQQIILIFSDIQELIYWSLFSYFFTKLKQQNFFRHFILNRIFFSIEIEILFFLLSVYFIFIVINSIFLFYVDNKFICNYIIIIMSLIIDAFFFTVSKIWKYLIYNIILVFFSLIACLLIFFLFKNETTISMSIIDDIKLIYTTKQFIIFNSVLKFIISTKVVRQSFLLRRKL